MVNNLLQREPSHNILKFVALLASHYHCLHKLPDELANTLKTLSLFKL